MYIHMYSMISYNIICYTIVRLQAEAVRPTSPTEVLSTETFLGLSFWRVPFETSTLTNSRLAIISKLEAPRLNYDIEFGSPKAR